MCVCVCSDRAEGLIALFDDVLQLSEHRDLCVLQLLLLGDGVRYTCPVGGLRLISLRTHIVCKVFHFVGFLCSGFSHSDWYTDVLSVVQNIVGHFNPTGPHNTDNALKQHIQ